MKSTQKQPATLLADQPTPATVLRQAAMYVWRYGWTFDGFYHRHDADEDFVAFPPACMAGAIRCVVFGRPVDSLYDEIIDPDHTEHARLITAAQIALADEVDPEWSVESPCTDKDVCALEVISDWNDVEDRTISDVLIALYSAADEWDRAPPRHRVGGDPMSHHSVKGTLTSKRRRDVVENDAYADFARRIIAAYSRRVATGDIEAITDLVNLSDNVDKAIAYAIGGLRAFGYSWADIGHRLGISRQACQQRWGGETP